MPKKNEQPEYSINDDANSKNIQKEAQRILAEAREEAAEQNLAPSIFGTNSTTYGSSGTNYNSYAEGKYSEVAKAENWSKWAIPDDKDERLEAYERKQLIKYTLLGIFVLGIIFYIVRKLLTSSKSNA